jgi:hypothetical protein
MYSVWIGDTCVICCRGLERAKWEALIVKAYYGFDKARPFIMPS